jgi:polysaccharide biosynthesis transport protein
MPPQPLTLDAETPGFGEYLSIIKKRRRLLFMVGLPIVALGVLLALGLPDVYRSSGNIEIEEQGRNVHSARDDEDAPYADQYVQRLSAVVLSDKSLQRLLAERQLYDHQNDDPDVALKRLRRDIDVDIVTVPILDPQTGREREIVSAFAVGYDNRDPQRAQQGATWLVDAFLSENRRDRQADAANQAKFFANEAERMRQHVGELEAKLAEFKAENAGQLPELNQANLGAMDRTESDIRNVEMQMQALRRERVFLMAQLQQARATGPEAVNLGQLEAEYRRRIAIYDESHPDVISLRRQIDTMRTGGSPSGMSLRAQLQQQRSILSETRQRYSADHPDVKRIQRNIDALEARIASGETADRSPSADSPMAMQLQTQLNATDSQLGALTARASELRVKLTELESRLTSAPAVERDFQIVTRDLASARAKYEELLERQMDAEVSEAAIAGGTADKFRVKSVPGLPVEPASPQRIAILLISAVLGSVLALTAVVLAQLLDQTVRGVRDIREILDVTPLIAVPVIQEGKHHRRSGFAFAARASAGIALGCCLTALFIR